MSTLRVVIPVSPEKVESAFTDFAHYAIFKGEDRDSYHISLFDLENINIDQHLVDFKNIKSYAFPLRLTTFDEAWKTDKATTITSIDFFINIHLSKELNQLRRKVLKAFNVEIDDFRPVVMIKRNISVEFDEMVSVFTEYPVSQNVRFLATSLELREYQGEGQYKVISSLEMLDVLPVFR